MRVESIAASSFHCRQSNYQLFRWQQCCLSTVYGNIIFRTRQFSVRILDIVQALTTAYITFKGYAFRVARWLLRGYPSNADRLHEDVHTRKHLRVSPCLELSEIQGIQSCSSYWWRWFTRKCIFKQRDRKVSTKQPENHKSTLHQLTINPWDKRLELDKKSRIILAASVNHRWQLVQASSGD